MNLERLTNEEVKELYDYSKNEFDNNIKNDRGVIVEKNFSDIIQYSMALKERNLPTDTIEVKDVKSKYYFRLQIVLMETPF